MVDQWATDIPAGHDPALLAWRRQDVADLNRLARARYDQLGHLHGDAPTAPGGARNATRAGVVTPAPNPTPHHHTRQQPPVNAATADHHTLHGKSHVKDKP